MRKSVILIALLVLVVGLKLTTTSRQQQLENDVERATSDNNLEPTELVVSDDTTQPHHSINPVPPERLFTLHAGLKDEFDAFIFAREGLGPDAMLAEYRENKIQQGYDGEQLAAYMDLFTRYVEYKVALLALEPEDGLATPDLEAITARMDALTQMRYDYFSEPEYECLFAEDVAFDLAAFERLRISQDPYYSEAQKAALIEQQLAALPESQKQGFTDSMEVKALRELAIQYEGETLYNAASAEFGAEVAARLQATTEKRQAWQKKVKSYKQWHNALQQDQQMTDAEQQQAIEQYMATHFSDAEKKRLRVFLENPDLLGI
ncbi:hypothetical protein FJ444_18690 [Aestuariibacter sp. GS-14]|uniref:lipase secretion chaperone n=1 Tax=Aestuariibacter sp. GS-14 TaxID=2590670 RepID=UPI001128006C|nr:lipase secretion chaperone [Aestuariibacter sp. GS-14]TPV54531.1 hypothetical protein FJ444_18690 [Aestuariibacter sp. GS-14]